MLTHFISLLFIHESHFLRGEGLQAASGLLIVRVKGVSERLHVGLVRYVQRHSPLLLLGLKPRGLLMHQRGSLS